MTSFAKHRFHTLDGARGIAAILVMVYHNFSPQPPYLQNAYLAVDFFFILSGFVVCHAYAAKLGEGMTYTAYLARRIGRIYPLVFISVLFGAPQAYHQTIGHVTDFTRRDFIIMLATNLSMLPYLTGKAIQSAGIFPTNNSLWSITFEMAASVCFPLLIRLDDKRLKGFCLGALALLIVSALLRGLAAYKPPRFDMNGGWNVENFYGGVPRVFFGFSCGMLLYRLWHSSSTRSARTRTLSPWLLYAALTLALLSPLSVTGLYPLFTTAIFAPLLVWLGGFSVCRDRYTMLLSQFLGWLSYPLYCLHPCVRETVSEFYRQTDIFSRLHIPEQIPSITIALALSITVGIGLDRLRITSKLTSFAEQTLAAATRRQAA